jgi:putative ABC transport system permease protein
MQSGAQVALLGSTAARELFPHDDPINQEIRIGRAQFTVIGVMESQGQSVTGRDQDDTVFVPLRSARQRIFGLNRANANAVNLLYVKVEDPERVAGAQAEVSDLLRNRHGLVDNQKADFGISNLAEIYAAHETSARTTSLLLAAVAAITMLAGGFGIASVMLASVTQRRCEIGLRVAVGARTRDIVAQFLSESVTIALLGALPGLLIGAAAAAALGAIFDWPILFKAQTMALTILGSALIGLAAGLIPAVRAAGLDPIEALQS